MKNSFIEIGYCTLIVINHIGHGAVDYVIQRSFSTLSIRSFDQWITNCFSFLDPGCDTLKS